MLECQHCQNPNYDTLSPAGCLLWGAAPQLTQLHSTGACGVASCSQIHNTLRLWETSHLILFTSHLLPGMRQRPRVSLFCQHLLSSMPIAFHHRLQILLVLGERRERKSQFCFVSIHCYWMRGRGLQWTCPWELADPSSYQTQGSLWRSCLARPDSSCYI